MEDDITITRLLTSATTATRDDQEFHRIIWGPSESQWRTNTALCYVDFSFWKNERREKHLRYKEVKKSAGGVERTRAHRGRQEVEQEVSVCLAQSAAGLAASETSCLVAEAL